MAKEPKPIKGWLVILFFICGIFPCVFYLVYKGVQWWEYKYN